MQRAERKTTAARILRGRLIPVIGAVIVFFVSLSVLYMGEHVGLSDNGDFRRVLLSNNISYADDTDYHYLFKEEYVMDKLDERNVFTAMWTAWASNADEEIYSSPHFLLIKISKELNVISNAVTGAPLSSYSIFWLALLYIFMLTVAALVIFTFFADEKIKVQAAVFALFIFMFCDAGYLLYFNSFYGEPLQYTALMMLIAFGMLIYKRPTVPKVVGFYIALYFFAGAKLANIPYSLLVALLAILISMMRRDKLFRIGVIVCAVSGIFSMIGLYSSIPQWMDRDTTYQAVFFGITKNSDDPAADLRELGVDEKYAVLAGTHAYMDGDEYPIDITTEEFERGFYDKVNKVGITAFWLRHPVRFTAELAMAIENSAYIRPPVVGNSRTVPMELTDKWSGWSRLRTALRFLFEPWVILAAFLLITVYMIFINIFYIHNHRIETPEKKYMIASLDILILGLWINLMLPVICNGEGDITKHMFLFTNCIDILFLVLILGIVNMPPKQMIKPVIVLAVLSGMFYIHFPKHGMTFGSIGGKPIEWEIERELDGGRRLLVTREPVAYLPFDDDTNRWESSDVRVWLNGGFLDEFTDSERERIEDTENLVPLDYENRKEADSGYHTHYWNFTRSMAGDMGTTAYVKRVTDKVFLPTLDMMKDIDVPAAFWILCPYTSNEFMQRFVNDDGFVLHTDVRNEKGVRAAIVIKPEEN